MQITAIFVFPRYLLLWRASHTYAQSVTKEIQISILSIAPRRKAIYFEKHMFTKQMMSIPNVLSTCSSWMRHISSLSKKGAENMWLSKKHCIQSSTKHYYKKQSTKRLTPTLHEDVRENVAATSKSWIRSASQSICPAIFKADQLTSCP